MADTGLLERSFSYLKAQHQVVTFKLNVFAPNFDDAIDDVIIENWWDQVEGHFCIARNFLAAKYGNILACSAGLHTQGNNRRPHMHFHFIVDRPYVVGRTSSAASNERARWVREQSEQTEKSFKEMTIKFSPLDPTKPLWQILAYPLKERKRGSCHMYQMIRDGGPYQMPVEIVDVLEQVGSNIFDAALALQERKEKAEIKKADDLQELYNWAFKNRSSFNTFREMQEYFEDVFLFKKIQADGVHALPEVNNYNRNLKKVGCALGIFRYCDDLSAK